MVQIYVCQCTHAGQQATCRSVLPCHHVGSEGRIGVVRLDQPNSLPISKHKENGVWMCPQEVSSIRGNHLETEVWKSWGGWSALPKYFLCLLRLWDYLQYLSSGANNGNSWVCTSQKDSKRFLTFWVLKVRCLKAHQQCREQNTPGHEMKASFPESNCTAEHRKVLPWSQ